MKKPMEIDNIHEAFIATQKEMREKYAPYYWTAFILIQ